MGNDLEVIQMMNSLNDEPWKPGVLAEEGVVTDRPFESILHIVGGMRPLVEATGDDYDLAVVYLAVGSLSVESDRPDMTVIKSVSLSEITKNVGRPRETVRRKLLRLVAKRMLAEADGQYRIADMEIWRKSILAFKR